MSNNACRDDALNGLTDSDGLWGPLCFLRPKPEHFLKSGRALALCMYLGAFHGMGANVVLMIVHRMTEQVVLPIFVLPLLVTAVLFGFAMGALAPAWNRRAQRIVRARSWAQAAQTAARGQRIPAPLGE